MLTSLEIENFKGIGARQRIDFAPLTLLFGANSAGKSTILQALVYLHELIERGAADVDRTELGGHVLELGGFARLVHQHDTTCAIVLRAEFATPGGLERLGRDLTDFPFPDLDDEVDSAWLELTIRILTTASFRGPIIERVRVGVNGDPETLVQLELGSSLRKDEPLRAAVSLWHPLLQGTAESVKARGESTIAGEWGDIALEGGWLRQSVPLATEERAPRTEFGLVFALARSRDSALPAPNEPLRVIPVGEDEPNIISDSADIPRIVEQVRTFLEMVVLGTTSQLAGFLRDAQYIGPLRTIPPRGFLYERAGRITSWADGLAAWDLLLADRLTLVERTNDWLRKLNVGCKVVVQQLFEGSADAEDVAAGHVDRTVRRLLLDTGTGSFVLPSEVGAGISQLIPVVVAAIEGRGGLSLVEQPEVHVHPAVQVGLGDLFIEAVSREGGKRLLLVETHSEHLVLRLLRRIRETTEKEVADESLAFNEAQLSVVYVESESEGVRARRLRVDEHGEFVDRWPKGFFAERMEELL